MIVLTADEIQTARTPRALADFVAVKRELIEADPESRSEGYLKKGLFKEFVDEVMPLSKCVPWIYDDNVLIQPVLGSQGYDARVLDLAGNVIEHIELAVPRLGDLDAKSARKLVREGVGVGKIWAREAEPLEDLFPVVPATANKKSSKDYGDCTLLFYVAPPFPPHESEMPRYSCVIERLSEKLSAIRLLARRVLLVVPHVDVIPISFKG